MSRTAEAIDSPDGASADFITGGASFDNWGATMTFFSTISMMARRDCAHAMDCNTGAGISVNRLRIAPEISVRLIESIPRSASRFASRSSMSLWYPVRSETIARTVEAGDSLCEAGAAGAGSKVRSTSGTVADENNEEPKSPVSSGGRAAVTPPRARTMFSCNSSNCLVNCRWRSK